MATGSTKKGYNIAYGVHTTNEKVPSNSNKDYIISYGRTFNSIPVVVASLLRPYTPYTEMTGPNIVAIGLDTFTVRYFNTYSAPLAPKTNWIAIEQ